MTYFTLKRGLSWRNKRACEALSFLRKQSEGFSQGPLLFSIQNTGKVNMEYLSADFIYLYFSICLPRDIDMEIQFLGCLFLFLVYHLFVCFLRHGLSVYHCLSQNSFCRPYLRLTEVWLYYLPNWNKSIHYHSLAALDSL